MVYIFNTNIKNEKKINKALYKIYGIGKNLNLQICDLLGISSNIRVKQLKNLQIEDLIFLINQNYIFGSELKRKSRQNIKRLIKIASYRGFRHIQGLPVRGQRTHTNSQTIRKFKFKQD